MNEKGLIEQVLRIINANYSNIYAIDIPADKVYMFQFTLANELIIKEIVTYTEFIEIAKKFVYHGELSTYFEALSLNKLEIEAQKGNNETKVKYRKLCETGEYRWFVNIINYLPFEGRKLIFMMSEDINERLISSETNSIKLENEIEKMRNQMSQESASVSEAIFQINNALENGVISNKANLKDTRNYINSIFNRLSFNHPELNKAILSKMSTTINYNKPSILIVDDSSIIRNSLKRIFVNEFNIIMAKNGVEAISLLKENTLSSNKFGANENIVGILLDLVMPESDGFEVLEFMKKNNLLSRIPVTIISGDETRETRKKVYEYEIVDMIEKPFNTESIRRRISKIINLYTSSYYLKNIVDIQSEELKENDLKLNEAIKEIVNKIVFNILNNHDSMRLKKIVKILATNLVNTYPKYPLSLVEIDAIVNTCPLYNIGSIAMKEDEVITGKTITEAIQYGHHIASSIIKDKEELKVAENIINYSYELYNGKGYPKHLSKEEIPIEAQITSLAVRINQYTKNKSFAYAVKTLTNIDAEKFNPDLITILNQSKKELKETIHV